VPLRNESLIEDARKDLAHLVALRHDLHAHPEIGLEEVRTAEIVARELANLGYQVHRGLAKTGVVGTLKLGDGRRTLGLRADIDALPILEATNLAYASKTAGKMHACGHDGHTTMLLGAARQIARRANFDGTLHLIFQPAEENVGGARIMIEDGLFDRFPCDAVFGAHNEPGIPVGQFGFREGPLMAAAHQVDITIQGKGGHGAMPEQTVDPIVAGASLVMALQTVVSRNVAAHAAAVITVGCLKAGMVSNVIPDTARLELSVRYFDDETSALLRKRIDELAKGQAASFGATATVTWSHGYPVTVNEAKSTRFAREAAVALLGEPGVRDIEKPFLGSEDFSFMLEKVPGSYLMMGNGDSAALHNPRYNFNDEAIAPGAAYWTTLAERFLRVA
jgi:hippurate hydrolase